MLEVSRMIFSQFIIETCVTIFFFLNRTYYYKTLNSKDMLIPSAYYVTGLKGPDSLVVRTHCTVVFLMSGYKVRKIYISMHTFIIYLNTCMEKRWGFSCTTSK